MSYTIGVVTDMCARPFEAPPWESQGEPTLHHIADSQPQMADSVGFLAAHGGSQWLVSGPQRTLSPQAAPRDAARRRLACAHRIDWRRSRDCGSALPDRQDDSRYEKRALVNGWSLDDMSVLEVIERAGLLDGLPEIKN
ncbi:hypothetical protein BHE90_013966 [Fusarium euwallaceae]|uniref:Uncharacterized protein n=2 Tax=Fusarium solani species complex TaxID=232080 RepID=A0A3M2RQ46_9HYPO|nr:hypothetical protein CDV36_013022 [Fusarium kuroshium]RTE71630.1 hypothetical protein BHE90_013966 [Fusarium euwallaceae]